MNPTPVRVWVYVLFPSCFPQDELYVGMVAATVLDEALGKMHDLRLDVPYGSFVPTDYRPTHTSKAP